ncbi:hypothetical protein COW36_08855 [bacterium (Candidatus Blackallbacteria) CG17_big_fil_post_rev_8_21_14_2_50_48_46]|uniref:Uncharacterized protein n=1 Tax=bacterium (Candidatus Blackallbacteria) CG17_big_fil_post_rev_8_21_14_2_50_48_46 TaxID=2014261 RepID=A0A2M7G6E4_9BACT|nr:MAG: hypothetical protein COW64_06155 [bacterium (Candidatus Blackallbacteria) CG18_big_fil_WC_8_21_14_2_50_49_26]PIW17594.1 MAG: hypothetical protein COW36_08855 [bacterium (Candidatus Blackallbacteria) CG17_big_fil_post_rev_8_21_14_2_50_48_46]PIW48449.1 MAG: hypothetical protein COW20_10205 [bacterium (Candidatus Blackallbacteria) CG13_big_fil_rev_8_21_14_2_50_49_14]
MQIAKTLKTLFSTGFCLVFLQLTAQAETLPRWQLNALPIANLAYQLDCMSGQGHCSREAFEKLWHEDLGWNPEDSEMLKAWQKLRQLYQHQIMLNPAPLPPTVFPLRFEGLDLSRKLRIAPLDARNFSEYASRANLLMRPQDADQALRILSHFYPRISQWWQAGAQAETERAAREFVEIAQKYALEDWLKQARNFYRSQESEHLTYQLDFFLRPGIGGNQHGEQLENHSLIEVLPSKSLLNQTPVTLHELSHFLYAQAPRELQFQLVDWFCTQKEAWAIPAYNLLNEVMATTLANGQAARRLFPAEQFQRYFKTKGSFYNDAYIDPVAKALLPRLEAALKNQENLYQPEFLKSYLSIFKQALGEKALAPELFLRTAGIVAEGQAMQAAAQNFQQANRIGVAWGSQNLIQGPQTFRHFPALSGALFLSPDQAFRLADWADLISQSDRDAILRAAQEKKPGVWGIQMPKGAWLFVFLAQKPEEFLSLNKRFQAHPQVFQGRL